VRRDRRHCRLLLLCNELWVEMCTSADGSSPITERSWSQQ
jgi:hypothetical protein